jgi:hypothetical protein
MARNLKLDLISMIDQKLHDCMTWDLRLEFQNSAHTETVHTEKTSEKLVYNTCTCVFSRAEVTSPRKKTNRILSKKNSEIHLGTRLKGPSMRPQSLVRSLGWCGMLAGWFYHSHMGTFYWNIIYIYVIYIYIWYIYDIYLYDIYMIYIYMIYIYVIYIWYNGSTNIKPHDGYVTNM